jgi:hypothetical protein
MKKTPNIYEKGNVEDNLYDPKAEGESPYEKYIQIVIRNKTNSVPTDNLRIDTFMKKHTGTSFRDFVDSAKPEEITEDSYGLFKRGSIKRDLFKTRAKAYLEALCDFEESGGNVQQILEYIREGEVPTLKGKKRKEPTCEAIYAALKT